MSTVLEVVYRDGQIELPPDAQIAENTRALLILLDESEQQHGSAASDVSPLPDADSQMEIVRRLRGIAKPDGPPPTDEEVRELYTDYLVEKYR